MRTGFPIALVAIAFLFSSQSLFAQHKTSNTTKKKSGDPDLNKTYKYEMESNDPTNAPNLSFTLMPFYGDIYTLNYNLGYGAYADYRLNNKLDFAGFYRGSYLDRFETSNGNPGQQYGYSLDETKPASSLGFSVMYYFKNDLSVKDHDITIKSHNNGSTQTDYVISVPAKRLQLFGIRAGFEKFNSTIYSGNGNITFNGKLVVPDTAYYNDLSANGPFSTYMRSNMLTIGICRTRISDVHVKVEDFGEKMTASVTELYFDLLYATNITYSDMLVSYSNTMGATTFRTYDVNTLTEKSKIGFRLGYSEHVNYKFKALGSFGLEMGLRPGPKAGFDNFFLLLKFGMNLSFHTGPKMTDVGDE